MIRKIFIIIKKLIKLNVAYYIFIIKIFLQSIHDTITRLKTSPFSMQLSELLYKI